MTESAHEYADQPTHGDREPKTLFETLGIYEVTVDYKAAPDSGIGLHRAVHGVIPNKTLMPLNNLP